MSKKNKSNLSKKTNKIYPKVMVVSDFPNFEFKSIRMVLGELDGSYIAYSEGNKEIVKWQFASELTNDEANFWDIKESANNLLNGIN